VTRSDGGAAGAAPAWPSRGTEHDNLRAATHAADEAGCRK